MSFFLSISWNILLFFAWLNLPILYFSNLMSPPPELLLWPPCLGFVLSRVHSSYPHTVLLILGCDRLVTCLCTPRPWASCLSFHISISNVQPGHRVSAQKMLAEKWWPWQEQFQGSSGNKKVKQEWKMSLGDSEKRHFFWESYLRRVWMRRALARRGDK